MKKECRLEILFISSLFAEITQFLKLEILHITFYGTSSNGGDEAPSFTESVLDSLETPYTREATQGTVSTNCSSADSYIPNFSSSDTIQGFSEMTTHHLSHAGLEINPISKFLCHIGRLKIF